MSPDLPDRVGFLRERLDALESDVNAKQERLAAAPRWYRPGMPPLRGAPADIATFNELERVRISVEQARTAIGSLRDLLREAELDPRPQKACYVRAIAWINRAKSWKDLARELVVDPGLGLERPRPVSSRVLQAILEYRDSQPRRQIRTLEELSTIRGVTEELLRNILHTGCTLRPPVPAAPTPAVPVLLPVRLETRFDPPGASWTMRLRIVPDEAAFDRFDALASAEELTLVERLWDATGGDLEASEGRAAWQELTDRVGGARAAWLAQKFPIGTPRPPQLRVDPYYGTLRGLPERLQVWLGRGGAAPQLVETLTVDRVAAARLDLPALGTGERRWWNSFQAARDVGLATSIDLGAQADDIDVVLVVGLSEEAPAAWFTNHCDGGNFGLVAPGTPTNTVEGEPAAALDGDPEHWLRSARGQATVDAGARAVAVALTGSAAHARPMVGGATDVGPVSRWLVQGLWHALWGHQMKDLFGLGAHTHLAGLWAAEALRPEGPLPTLRIGSQPYGLLPVTALDRWAAGPNDPRFEAAALDCLRSARDAWAAVAEQAGTVEGADTDALLDLLGRTPASDAYAWRWFLPLEVMYLLWWLFGLQPGWQDMTSAYEAWVDRAQAVCGHIDPQLALVAFGWPVDLGIPLVTPDNISEEDFRALLKVLSEPRFDVAAIFEEGGWKLLPGKTLPNSLLARLLLFAHWVAAAEVAREQKQSGGAAAPPWVWSQNVRELLHADARNMVHGQPGGPALELRFLLQQACAELAGLPLDEIERALRGVLDTASHRLDPWLTGYALRRLEDEGAAWPRQLGLYGWVDAPRPGTPGPTAGGLLHAPSQAQAYTAMVLRDRAISDPEAGRWDMDLDSRAVRAADQIGAGVRAGGHLAEVVGAEVERVVGDATEIDGLRSRFPILAEHAGRRVCDGVAVLAADPVSLGLPAGTLSALDELRQAIDAYGDLLVAQAVHDVVSGRGERAGAAMDAAAGLAAPPSLEVIHTPRVGRTAATTAVFCLPQAPDPVASLDTSPTVVADPAFAAFVADQTGAASGPAWTWEADGPGGAVVSVTLANLVLEPHDAAVIPAATLAALVQAAAGADAAVRPGSAGFATHRRARALVLVGGSEPAETQHLVTDPNAPVQGVADDLRGRLLALEALAISVRDAIAAAVGGSDTARATALHLALRWGVASIDGAEVDVDDQVEGAAAALTDRLRTLPPVAERPALSAAELGRLIAELAVADGRWPVLGRIDLTLIPTVLSPAAELDDEWLPVVATVRPALAPVEALQLDGLLTAGSAPLSPSSSRPGDPWQQAGVRDPDTGRMPDSHLLVAYGPPGALAGAAAVGLLDHWSEVVPEAEQTTTAGFGFNAPGSRAPQAILIGVPPAPDGVLVDGDLAAIVLEARRLARVRVAQATGLGDVSAVVPTMLLPATEPAGVDL